MGRDKRRKDTGRQECLPHLFSPVPAYPLSPVGVFHGPDDVFAYARIAELVFVSGAEADHRAAAVDAVDDLLVAVAAAGPFDDGIAGNGGGAAGRGGGRGAGVV